MVDQKSIGMYLRKEDKDSPYLPLIRTFLEGGFESPTLRVEEKEDRYEITLSEKGGESG